MKVYMVMKVNEYTGTHDPLWAFDNAEDAVISVAEQKACDSGSDYFVEELTLYPRALRELIS